MEIKARHKIHPLGNIFLSLLLIGLAVWLLCTGEAISNSVFGLIGIPAHIVDILFYGVLFYLLLIGILSYYTYDEREFIIHFVLSPSRKIAMGDIIFLTQGYSPFAFTVGYKFKGRERMQVLLTIGAKKKVKEFAAFLRQQNPDSIISSRVLQNETDSPSFEWGKRNSH